MFFDSLIVIDMQELFETAEDEVTQRNVIKEIRKAIDKENFIFVTEFRGCGPTLPIIMEELKYYPKYKIIYKNFNDGSFDIFPNYFKEALPWERVTKNMHKDKVTIVGVNLKYCVWESALGLSLWKGFDVRIKLNACNDEKMPKNMDNFVKRAKLHGIKVI